MNKHTVTVIKVTVILQTLESEIRMFESVQAGDSVLLVWADLGSSPDMFQAAVISVKEAAGECLVTNGNVACEDLHKVMTLV